MADLCYVALANCCASIAAQIQFAFCNTRTYGTDANCCDNCCRFNCGWKQGQLPVEDYPIANSAPEDKTQTIDGSKPQKEGEGQLPAYEATAPMTVPQSAPPVREAGGDAGTAKPQSS